MVFGMTLLLLTESYISNQIIKPLLKSDIQVGLLSDFQTWIFYIKWQRLVCYFKVNISLKWKLFFQFNHEQRKINAFESIYFGTYPIRCWERFRFLEDKLLVKNLPWKSSQFFVTYKVSDHHWHQEVSHEDSFWLWWINNFCVYWTRL